MYKLTVDDFKKDPKKNIKQLESCNYECVAGSLNNNIAFIALKELIVEGKIK
jgi:hypothetical protein